ncbi:glycosyltransferase family 4 protein [Vibrio sp. C8]
MKYLFVCSRLDTMYVKRERLFKLLLEAGNEVSLLSMERHDETENELKGLGVKYYPINGIRNKISIISDFKLIRNIYLLLKKINPDVVVTYTIKPNVYTGLVARLLPTRTKFIPVVTGLGFAFQQSSLVRKAFSQFIIQLHRYSFSNAHLVILQNESNKALFSQTKIARKSKMLVVAGDGVEIPDVTAKKFDKGARFICVARLLGEKGLRELNRAVKVVKTDFPDFSVELYGGLETSPDAITQLEVESWKKDGTLVWKGYCDSVGELLREADIFILPSYHEGMCTSISEAISYGLPIIGTNIAGIREMVDGNGILVEPKNSDDLAEGIRFMLSINRSKLSEMSGKSLDIARSSFDRKKLMQEMYKAITR